MLQMFLNKDYKRMNFQVSLATNYFHENKDFPEVYKQGRHMEHLNVVLLGDEIF